MSGEHSGKAKIKIYMAPFVFMFAVIKQLSKHDKTSIDGDCTIWGKAKLR